MSHDVGMTWSSGFLPGDLYSHSDRLLKDHLDGTAELALCLAELHGLGIDPDLLRSICETHDLEKANSIWQEYLLGEKPKGPAHAFPSSCFTLDLTRDLWAAEAVRRHHTHMENAKTSCQFWLKRYEDLAELQCHMKEVISSWACHVTEEEWESFIDGLFDMEVSSEDWLTLRSLYSLLVTADRMDAIGVSELNFAPLPEFTTLDFAKNGATPLDGWRQNVHDLCLGNAAKIKEPGLYTLTLPTGAGKTIVGLEIAHILTSKFGYSTIIYALPFISIIEQNASVAKALFGTDNVQEDHSRAYGEVKEESRAGGSSWARMSALFRYWRTPVVLTTMVQLWDSIFDPRANASMDFHRLSRAVVVLDEPQGIDPGLWDGFGRMLSFLSEKWGTVFILMTATQPHVGEGREIAPLNLDFPYNRHAYHILPGKFKLDKLQELLYANLPVDEGSGLIVLNTRKSALKAYQILQERFNAPVLFLSAWMNPRHRRRVMRYLKYLEKTGIRHYLISTQVVEAGVDLDFDWVFRDMGPLDSVIQVAGRCNRHANREEAGKVLVAELMGSNGKTFCSMVYNDVLLANSKDILVSETVFDEKRVPQLVKDYYGKILEGLSYKPVWDNIEKGLWGPQDKEDLIVKRDYQNETVFVEWDCHLRPVLERLRTTHWTLERLDEKKQLVRQAQQYSIEVSLKELVAWQEKIASVSTHDHVPLVGKYEGEEYWFIARAAMNIAYDRVTGFVPVGLSGGSGLDDSFL